MNRRIQQPALLVLLLAVAGCSETPNAPLDSATKSVSAVAFNTVGAPTVEFSVPDMMCEASCAKAVKETLAGQAGVVDVVVDFPKRLATVAVDKKKFDADAALAALLDKQFTEAKLVK